MVDQRWNHTLLGAQVPYPEIDWNHYEQATRTH